MTPTINGHGRQTGAAIGFRTVVFHAGYLFVPAMLLLLPFSAFGDAISPLVSAVLPPGFSNVYASSMAIGSDGNVWIAEQFNKRVGKLTITANSDGTNVSTYTAYATGPTPIAITAGPDGNLWFTGDLGTVTRLTTQGAMTTFAVQQGSQSQLGAITTGPDGAVWFIDGGFVSGTTKLGRMAMDGSVVEFNVAAKNAYIQDLTTGADGNLWFVDGNGPLLYKVSTAGSVLGTFPIPSHGAKSIRSAHIILGPDGNVWFPGNNTLDRATPAGVITEYPIPTANAFPAGVAIGADGNLWFTEHGTGQIGELVLSSATDSGQATILESNLSIAFAITQADQLTMLPPPPNGSTANAADGPTSPHCRPVAFLVDSTASFNTNLTQFQVANPTTCADVMVSADLFSKKTESGATVLTAEVSNNGPDVAKAVEAGVVITSDQPPSLVVATHFTFHHAADPPENYTPIHVTTSADGKSFRLDPTDIAPQQDFLNEDKILIDIVVSSSNITGFIVAGSKQTPDVNMENNKLTLSAIESVILKPDPNGPLPIVGPGRH